ncbi:MAG: SoxY-related AACIE arm protein [Pseudomonadota bacterium]
MINRRTFIQATAGLATVSLVPAQSMATPGAVQTSLDALFDGRPLQAGRVTLALPPIAENGNSVSLEVDVDSPMTAEDHVRRIAIFAERNPLPDVARFTLGPRAGRARVATRVRLSDTQTILAVAEMNDGRLFTGTAETVVTLAACIIL